MVARARIPDCHPTELHHSNGVCRKCYKRAWYLKNRERMLAACAVRRQEKATEIAAYKKNWRAKKADYVKAEYQRWYAETRPQRLAVMRAARERDPAARVQSTRAWRRENPERYRAQARAQRAKRRAWESGHEEPAAGAQELASAAWVLFGRCYYCGECAGDAIEADHLVPLSSGGSPASHNIVPACRACNASKSDDDALAWLTTGRRANDPRFEPARRRLRRAA